SLGGPGSIVKAGPRSPGELSRAEGSRSPARFVRISMRLFSVGRRFGLAAEYGGPLTASPGRKLDGGDSILTADVGEQVTDAELAVRFRRDPESFIAVYNRYIKDIYRYVAGRLDAQAAEDLAAETFCVAFDRRDRFDPERGNLRPWLFGIATTLVARHRRKEARHHEALFRMRAEPAAEGHENP